MRKVGIYGGTFDPVHDGHIAFAASALRQLTLDEVIFLPEATPSMKPNSSDIKQRFEQIKHELTVHAGLDVIQVDEPHFSVTRTIPLLEKRFADCRLYFLFGSDTVMTMQSWMNISLLLKFPLIIGIRSQHMSSEIEEYMKSLAVENKTEIIYEIVDTDYGHYSSSEIKS